MITGHLYAGQLEVDIFEMKSLRVIRGQQDLFNETKKEDQNEDKNEGMGTEIVLDLFFLVDFRKLI